MATEIPDRGMQAELVFQQIRDPISREALRSSMPADQLINYDDDYASRDHQQKLKELVRREGGNAYRYIFAAAAVAQNPTQLANTFGMLASLEDYSLGFDFIKRLEQAKADFLRSTVSPAYTSDGARALQAEIIAVWNEFGGVSGITDDRLRDKYMHFPYYRKEEQTRVNQFWSEAYMLTVLDPNTPIKLREYLLQAARRPLHYGAGTKSYDREYLERFAQGVSFWQQVDGSWLYPDLFGQFRQSGGDIKDWEIAGLRRDVSKLQQQLNEHPVQTHQPQRDPKIESERSQIARERQELEQEKTELRRTADNMRRFLEKEEEKMRIYREIGRHPLEALGIGITVWRSYSPDQRGDIVRQAYRALARKYLYQVPRSDPKYDPLLAELANKEFTRINNAYNYLNGNLDKDDF